MDDVERAGELAKTAAGRSAPLIDRLATLDDEQLAASSALPGWSRLTIVCHLRYGTTAMLRMTDDALAGRETAYYPEGRATQRPRTLQPSPGETPADVLADWRRAALALDGRWRALGDGDWATTVVEPADNPDLGRVPLARLALARLTEVDVHGTDLMVGAPEWSDVLVEVALPVRLGWLATRRSNHRTVDDAVQGTWLLEADEGLRWAVTVERGRVRSQPAVGDEHADASIAGPARDLLALLLGRAPRRPLRLGGDARLASSFGDAFPGP